MELERRFADAMTSLGIPEGGRCLVAFSGGGDSTALLELCHRTAGVTGRHYTALRVRHGIRGQAEEEAEALFCRDFCAERRIPFVEEAGEMVPGGGPEQAARTLRYRILNSYAQEHGFDFILLAHSRDDNRETLLMRFFNGSGPEGLKGIPASRDRLRRPLLGIGGRELRGYLAIRGIDWCEDATNRENDYLRNSIRNRLIPVIDDIFPGWDSAADTLLQRSAEAAAEINGLVKQSLAGLEGPDTVRWDRRDWEKAGDYSRGLALLAGMNRLESGEDSRIPWSRIRELREGADRGQDRSAGGFRIVNSSDAVSLVREDEKWEGRTVILCRRDLEGWSFRQGSMSAEITAEIPDGSAQDITIDYPFEIRWRTGRDEFGFHICPPDSKPIRISPERPVKLTEKTSVDRTPDADNHIVYIHIEKV